MVYYLIGNLIWISLCRMIYLMKLWLEKFTEPITLTRVAGVYLSWDLDVRFNAPLFHLSMRTYSLYHTMLSNSVIQICCFVFQNTKNANGQVKYLVYCMENAILNLPHGQDQMVWLIDFAGFNLGNLSIHVTKLTADVLQGHYLERLGVAVLYIHSLHIDSSKRLLSRVWIFFLILEQGLLIYLIIMLSYSVSVYKDQFHMCKGN